MRNLYFKKKHVFAISRACARAKKIWSPESDSQGNFLSGTIKNKNFHYKTSVWQKKRKKFSSDFKKMTKKLKSLPKIEIVIWEAENWPEYLFLIVLQGKNTLGPIWEHDHESYSRFT